MPISLIEGNPTFTRTVPKGEPFLNISEFFCDTIQGENFVGWPAAFLRMQSCTMSCIYCDTQEVWRFGNPYTFSEIFDFMEQVGLPEKLRKGQHLVLTGGSPLLQQDSLIDFIHEFVSRYHFKPFIEIENECTLMPHQGMVEIVDLWNNSPKLKGSGNSDWMRYQPNILHYLHTLSNSWFKFVISCDEDWRQIQDDFINEDLLHRDQVVLMPLGATRTELFANREEVIRIAIRENVRYTTREHVAVWDKKTGI